MPSASRLANRKRRARRNISLLTRQFQQEALGRTKVVIHLLSILAQKGGEITVTKGTIDQVVAGLTQMSYSIDKGETENEFIFRLVTQIAPEQQETPVADAH